jgi:hypothetical protein
MIPPPRRTVLILALTKPATLHVAEAIIANTPTCRNGENGRSQRPPPGGPATDRALAFRQARRA